MQTNWVT